MLLPDFCVGMRRLHQCLRNEYGGTRGFFTHLQAIALHRFGRWEKHRQIDLREVKRFVFVSLGNVCRSPYVVARARAMGLPSISCGLDVRRETPANTQAQAETLKHGVDLSSHRSRAFEPGHGSQGDLLIGMEPSHLDGIGAVVRRAVARLTRRRSQPAPPSEPPLTSGVTRHGVMDLHDPATLDLVRGLVPDLGVVAGTYILREKLFSIPRLGSINLHSGKAPSKQRPRASSASSTRLISGSTAWTWATSRSAATKL